ncbi:MAG TPA: hypothetical protein VEK57_00345 [Thermoanaerobaculia bacterium]|nr:hypothetical protein [Thermoanaerobaculia bacterium]
MDWTSLPGGELIREGLDDAAAGRLTIASLLVAIGAPRLRRAGLDVPDLGVTDPSIECTRCSPPTTATPPIRATTR